MSNIRHYVSYCDARCQYTLSKKKCFSQSSVSTSLSMSDFIPSLNPLYESPLISLYSSRVIANSLCIPVCICSSSSIIIIYSKIAYCAVIVTSGTIVVLQSLVVLTVILQQYYTYSGVTVFSGTIVVLYIQRYYSHQWYSLRLFIYKSYSIVDRQRYYTYSDVIVTSGTIVVLYIQRYYCLRWYYCSIMIFSGIIHTQRF